MAGIITMATVVQEIAYTIKSYWMFALGLPGVEGDFIA